MLINGVYEYKTSERFLIVNLKLFLFFSFISHFPFPSDSMCISGGEDLIERFYSIKTRHAHTRSLRVRAIEYKTKWHVDNSSPNRVQYRIFVTTVVTIMLPAYHFNTDRLYDMMETYSHRKVDHSPLLLLHLMH